MPGEGGVSEMGRAALAYARAGFAVFPCKETHVKEAGSKQPYVGQGFKAASREADVVADWWRRWPNALIGFPTGPQTRSLVVDLDAKESRAPDILLSLRRFADFRGAPVSRTQSDGLHIWFAYPGEEEIAELRAAKPDLKSIGNRGGLFWRVTPQGLTPRVPDAPRELAYVDVRGAGGYVIAPPSLMDNGRFYEWLLRPGPDWALPPAPHRLLRLIAGVDEVERPAPPRRAPPVAGRAGRYVNAAIEGVCATARAAPPGLRNQTVFECAQRLGDFVRGGQLSRGEAEALLFAHLPAGVSAGEKKIQMTIRNGLEGGTHVFEPGSLTS